ncbi:MAG: hypothetical protein MJ121_05170 [Clostridia bacterium]|nr:hypothetical protein [Clostridia bacterium]
MTQTLNSFNFIFKNHSLKLTATAKGVWRIQSQHNFGFDDMGAAQTLAKDLGESFDNTTLPLVKEGSTVTAEGFKVVLTPKSVEFYDDKNSLRRTLTDITTDDSGITAKFALAKDERIYGTGERLNKVNQRGKHLQMYAIDRWCQTEGNSYAPVPIMVSSNLSAIFLNRYERSILNIGFPIGNIISATQMFAPLDIYIIIKDSPCDILTAYSDITGFAPMPPEWAFGTFVCRYRPDFSTKEGILKMAADYEANDFPWDAAVIEGYGTYKKERWQELKEASEGVHAYGKKMLMYEQCCKIPENADKNFNLTDNYALQSDNGVMLKETVSVNFIDNFARKKMKVLDVTNPEALKKWREIWEEMMYQVGVDGAKIDFCEQFPDDESLHYKDGRNPRITHHWLPTYYNTMRYNHFNEKEDGGIVFSRGGGIGSQRFPYIWAGDQRREFKFLGVVIKAALSAGLSGIPFVSWDMAGYQPAWNPYDKAHESDVFVRGLQFTAFSPLIQTHGTVKRPYDFDEHTKDLYRAYAKIHEALRPYLMETALEATKTGMPNMRHLFLYDHTDPKCLDTEDEYMLGNSLLVAPILSRVNKRDIYLPKGKWIEIFSGVRYDGNQTIKGYAVPRERIPVFLLEGSETEALVKSLKNARRYMEDVLLLEKNK